MTNFLLKKNKDNLKKTKIFPYNVIGSSAILQIVLDVSFIFLFKIQFV